MERILSSKQIHVSFHHDTFNTYINTKDHHDVHRWHCSRSQLAHSSLPANAIFTSTWFKHSAALPSKTLFMNTTTSSSEAQLWSESCSWAFSVRQEVCSLVDVHYKPAVITKSHKPLLMNLSLQVLQPPLRVSLYHSVAAVDSISIETAALIHLSVHHQPLTVLLTIATPNTNLRNG